MIELTMNNSSPGVFSSGLESGAEAAEGTRTLNIQDGNLTLYQLSYRRGHGTGPQSQDTRPVPRCHGDVARIPFELPLQMR